MTIEARRIAHKSRTRKGVTQGELCSGGEPIDGQAPDIDGILTLSRAHTSACNELTSDIYEALLRVKYMRAAK